MYEVLEIAWQNPQVASYRYYTNIHCVVDIVLGNLSFSLPYRVLCACALCA